MADITASMGKIYERRLARDDGPALLRGQWRHELAM